MTTEYVTRKQFDKFVEDIQGLSDMIRKLCRMKEIPIPENFGESLHKTTYYPNQEFVDHESFRNVMKYYNELLPLVNALEKSSVSSNKKK